MSQKAQIAPQKQPQEGLTGTSIPKPRKLLDQVGEALRTKHYSYRTEQTYKDWIKRFILFHGKRHPKELGVEEIRTFLTHLAADRSVAAATALLTPVRTRL